MVTSRSPLREHGLHGEIGRTPVRALAAGLGDLVIRMDGRAKIAKGSINQWFNSSPEQIPSGNLRWRLTPVIRRSFIVDLHIKHVDFP